MNPSIKIQGSSGNVRRKKMLFPGNDEMSFFSFNHISDTEV